MLGVLIIAVMMDMLDADVDLAVKILLLLVFREIGPLAAAVVVILRTGTAISAEMAMMRVSGQTRALRYLGIDLYDYLVLPRVAGVMLATAALTLYMQFLAVLGGLVLSPFIIEASFTELAGRLFDLFTPVDFFYSIDQEPAVRLRDRRLLLLARPQSARSHAERRAEGRHARGDAERDAGARSSTRCSPTWCSASCSSAW